LLDFAEIWYVGALWVREDRAVIEIHLPGNTRWIGFKFVRARDKQTKTSKSGWLFVVLGCDSDDMQCGGRCVPDHQICDGISHCPKGEDERNCCMYKFFSVGSIVIDIDGH